MIDVEHIAAIVSAIPSLTPQQARLFYVLRANAGRVVTNDMIDDLIGSDHTVDITPGARRSTMKRLRVSLRAEGRPEVIHAHYGLGYRMTAPEG